MSQQAVASDLMRHIEFFDLFGGLYSYPSSRIRVEVKGFHLSSAGGDLPYARSGFGAHYEVYTQGGVRVYSPNLNIPSQYLTDYRQPNQTTYQPDLTALSEDYTLVNWGWGEKYYNSTVLSSTVTSQIAHWYLINDFAIQNVQVPDGGAGANDVNSSAPLLSLSLGLMLLGRRLRKK